MLKSKQKQLKRLGKGNKPQEASSLTPEEIDVLFEKKQFGASSPKALINTLWFNNCLHFGLRGGKEQRDLNWGDIVLKADSSGGKFVVYVYIINRIIHSRLEIWNLFSCVQIEHLTRSLRSLVRYQFEHPYLRAPVYYSLYILFIKTVNSYESLKVIPIISEYFRSFSENVPKFFEICKNALKTVLNNLPKLSEDF